MRKCISQQHLEIMDYISRTGRVRDHYFYACFMEQVLSDMLLLQKKIKQFNESSRETKTLLIQVRNICVELADALYNSTVYCDSKFMGKKFENWYAYATEQLYIISNCENLDICSSRLIDKIQDWTMPECSGYDLCDFEICRKDADLWMKNETGQSNTILIGVRSGGSYFVPFWANSQIIRYYDNPYITVRPVRLEEENSTIFFFDMEFETPPGGINGKEKIVIIDDQPDTGETLVELNKKLRKIYGEIVPVAAFSPGHSYQINSEGFFCVKSHLPIENKKHKRIWQGSEKKRNEIIISHLKANGFVCNDMNCISIENFVSHFTEKYKSSKIWMWWKDPSISKSKPLRINPRKTPLLINIHGKKEFAVHAKFIGTDLFGDFQFIQLLNFSNIMPHILFYQDGYLFTRFENGLINLKDIYPFLTDIEKIDLLKQVCEHWYILYQRMKTLGNIKDTFLNFRDIFSVSFNALKKKTGIKSRIDAGWISNYIPVYLNKYGRVNTLIRSSLPYSHHYWHWKVKKENSGKYRLFRFHIDSNWGTNTCIDTEIASFLLENRIFIADAQYICTQIKGISNPCALYAGVIERLTAALYYNIKSWLRRYKELSSESFMIIENDLDSMVLYIENFFKNK